MNKEIRSLTGVRGIAALWVVLLHFIYVSNFQSDNVYLDAGNEFLMKGNLGVDLFFMLSAFVLSLAYKNVFNLSLTFKDVKNFYVKRFIRIYPAYIFWLLLTAFVYKTKLLHVIIVNLLMSQNFFNPDKYTIGYVFWSLCAEWWMYMIFPFVYYVLNRFLSRNLLYISSLFIISIVGLYLLSSIKIFYIGSNGFEFIEYEDRFSVFLGINSVIRCLLCYFIGIALFFISRDERIKMKIMLGPKSVYVICGVVFSLSLFRQTDIYIIICLALLILSLYENREFDNFFSSKIVYFLGLISYSLYLIHSTLRFVITIIVMKIFNVPVTLADFPSIILSLVLLIPISYISYLYIEKKPGTWLKSKVFVMN
jgi:Predicted acyltransferases